MHTLSLIRKFLPEMHHAQSQGVFSHETKTRAHQWHSALAQAALKDHLDISGLLSSLALLTQSNAFETQQDELVSAIAEMDALLGDIQAGAAVRIERKLADIDQLISSIVTQTRTMIDVFSVPRNNVENIKRAAAEVHAIVSAEVHANQKPASALQDAALLYEHSLGLSAVHYREREQSAVNVLIHAGRLAA